MLNNTLCIVIIIVIIITVFVILILNDRLISLGVRKKNVYYRSFPIE
jgi:hypothetical protein